MTILYYMTLSIYRIDRSKHMLALFVTFATVNSIYCCRFLPAFRYEQQLIAFSYLGSGDGLVTAPA